MAQKRLAVRLVGAIVVALLLATLLVGIFAAATDDGPDATFTGDDAAATDDGPNATSPSTSTGDDAAAVEETTPAFEQASDLPPIRLSELPPEALDTLGLVGDGGPFPYDQDGSVFQNREGLLPQQETGYYREFTVVTPGADDRGARRLVIGEQGDVYWTGDHYASFAEVVP